MALNPDRDENFQFSNAAELRDWLNQFKETDLQAVCFLSGNGDSADLTIRVIESGLTDHSTVTDLAISLT